MDEALKNEEVYNALITLFTTLGAGLAVWGCIVMVNSETEAERKMGLEFIKMGGETVLYPYKVLAQLGV